MQPINLLKATLEEKANKTRFLFSAQDFSSVFPDFTKENMRMLLSRAAKSGILQRVCKGLYLYPKSGFDSSTVLFKVASRLRANYLNYISLESALSQEGIISQQLLAWLTVMTTGRSGTIDCGRFGTVELIHTAKSQEKIIPHLRLDTVSGMWRADKELAMMDMKNAKRNLIIRNF